MVLVRYQNRNPNWPILLANTETKTTFERKNLANNNMGYFFKQKGPFKIRYQIFKIFRIFLKICVQLLKTYIPLRSGKTWQKVTVSEKKSFSICTLVHINWKKSWFCFGHGNHRGKIKLFLKSLRNLCSKELQKNEINWQTDVRSVHLFFIIQTFHILNSAARNFEKINFSKEIYQNSWCG